MREEAAMDIEVFRDEVKSMLEQQGVDMKRYIDEKAGVNGTQIGDKLSELERRHKDLSDCYVV